MKTFCASASRAVSLLALLVVGFVVTSHVAHAAVLDSYDFNTPGDLASYFNNDAGEAYVESVNGGLSDSRGVSVDAQEGLYAAKDGYPELSTGQTLTLSTYFYNDGSSGYGSLGFVDASPSNGSVGVPTAHNLSVVFHGGGGDLYHNGITAANFSFPGGDLENLTWYRVIFSITKESNANSYASNVQFWKSDANGNLITQVFDASVEGFVNADLAGQNLYPFFGTGQTDRIVKVDNVEITDELFVGGPTSLLGSGTENDPWQLSECYDISESGYYKLMSNITDAVETCIEINANDVDLDGDSHSITGGAGDAGIIGIAAQERSGIKIYNITLDAFEDGISFLNVSGNSEVSDSIFTNMRGNAIGAEGVDQFTISGNIVDGTAADGILIGENGPGEVSPSSYVTITGNTISNNTDHDAIQVEYTTHATISNNIISHTGDDGIYVSSSNLITISGNSITDVADDGIDVNADEETGAGFEITQNTITTTGDTGMELEDMENSTVSENTVSGAGSNGLDFDNITGFTVENNTLGAFKGGIYISDSSDNTITGNTLHSSSVEGLEIPKTPTQYISVNPGAASAATDGETYTDFGNYTLAADDEYFGYDLPFTFNFKGRDITRISVSTNGSVELLEDGEHCGGGDMTSDGVSFRCDDYGSYRAMMAGNDVLFANTDDLEMSTTPGDYVGVFNPEDGSVIIDWFGTTYYDTDSNGFNSSTHPIHFQIVLHSGGTVDWNMDQLHYQDYSNNLFTGAYDGETEELYIAGFGLNEDNASYSGDFSGSGVFDATEVSPSFTGVELNTTNNTTVQGNFITADTWIFNNGTGNVFNTSNAGNTYYFITGLGAWTTYDIKDSNKNGYAEQGKDRPFNQTKLGSSLWRGIGQDLYPGTQTKGSSKKVGGYASAGYLASHGISLASSSSAPVAPTAPTLTLKDLCPTDQILTQNLKAPSQNGKYHPYTKAIVKDAKILQTHLNRLGFNSGVVDGFLGPITDGAIKRMQVFLKTTPDGYVGPITRNLINNSCTK